MSGTVVCSGWVLQSNVELGSGGYGRVVEAVKTGSNQKAACKIISTARMKITAIEKEIQLMQRLKHENIIEFKGAEEDTKNKKVFILMELAGNGELFSRVIDAGSLPEDHAWPYFKQLMSAVEYMHQQKVVHRDLKLENVLLNAEDVCKVCDFGLAHSYKPGDKLDGPDRVRLHEICGSKSYCAPEVLRGTGYDGFPTDVWSCGICLFAMLAGFFPLDEASGSDWRYERVKLAASNGCSSTHTIFNFYERPCLLSDEVTQIIDNMLAVDPERRLKVHEVLASPWTNGKSLAKYRGNHAQIDNVNHAQAQAQIKAMYDAEGHGDKPVYRGLPEADMKRPEGVTRPPITKQNARYREADGDGMEVE